MFKNSVFYFLLLLVIIFIAFWETYFSKLPWGIDSYIHFHALTMLLWVVMLISQAYLIRNKRFALHQTLGKLSYVLVPFIVVSLLMLAHNNVDPGSSGISPTRLYILFLQLSLLFVFVLAYSLAIFYRHSPVNHARYMICTALTMVDPAVARLPVDLPEIPFSYQIYTFGLVDIILLTLIVLERNKKSGRIVFPFMLVVFLIVQSLNLSVTSSDAWSSFAVWFASLPMT